MKDFDFFGGALHFSEHDLKTGRVLLSEPFLPDPNFSRAMVMLVEHTKHNGSIGFIVNKPLNMNLSDVMDDLGDFDAPLLYGGPVQTDTLHFLHRIGTELPNSIEVMPGLYWGGDFQQLKEGLLSGKYSSKDVIFYLGYSGWSKDQLAEELETKSWIVHDIDFPQLFDVEPSKLWQTVLHEMGGLYKVMSNYPLVASYN